MLKTKSAAAMLAFLCIMSANLACGLLEQAPAATRAPQVNGIAPPPSPPVTPSPRAQLDVPVEQPTTAIAISPTEVITAGSSEWYTLRQGLDRREVNLLTEDGGVQERLYILRIDPAYYEFDIGYKPEAPQKLMEWQQQTGALIVVNGGYFTADNIATGLTIVNGQASGASYNGFGGMLAIGDSGPVLRSLVQQPYNPGEPLRAGLQSFPLLVASDGQAAFHDEDGLADRRTVIAQDRQGRILFIIAATGTMTLREMSQHLATSNLDIVLALNLDGGASTGIQLADPPEGVAPFTMLPQVIIVRPKA